MAETIDQLSIVQAAVAEVGATKQQAIADIRSACALATGHDEILDDAIAEMKSYFGAIAANGVSDAEAEYAIAEVESWITDNVSNGSLDQRIAGALTIRDAAGLADALKEAADENAAAPSRPSPSTAPIYLHLFHGRAIDQQLDGWGFNGPTFGPLEFVHTTYGTDVKLGFQNEADAETFNLDLGNASLAVVDGCLLYDGHLFGDWTVSTSEVTGLYRIGDERFEATYHSARARLAVGQDLVDISGDGEFLVAKRTGDGLEHLAEYLS